MLKKHTSLKLILAITIPTALTCALLILKGCDVISIPWWITFLPLAIVAIPILVVFIASLFLGPEYIDWGD